ncbi:MAG: DUF6151 family protein [Myxococcota bacterium]
MADLAVACACGTVRGVARDLSPDRGNHLVCSCDDCQAFAHFLGDAADHTDAHGGTEILQTSPARLSIHAGGDHLACMRLRPKGLLRWYADCCRAPIGNTHASGRVPFVGLFCSAFRPRSAEVETALGPIRARVNARFAQGDLRLEASEGWSLPMILSFARIVLGAWVRGDARRSPFFDPETGASRATPRVLTGAERGEVEAARDAGAGQASLR